MPNIDDVWRKGSIREERRKEAKKVFPSSLLFFGSLLLKKAGLRCSVNLIYFLLDVTRPLSVPVGDPAR